MTKPGKTKLETFPALSRMSAAGGKPDGIDTFPDIRARRSGIGGMPVVPRTYPECRGVAKRGNHAIDLFCEEIAKRISASYRLFFRDKVTAIQAQLTNIVGPLSPYL